MSLSSARDELQSGLDRRLAGAISGLSSVSNYRDDAKIRALLLSGLTASVISTSSCLSMLSTVYVDPVNIERHWKSSGIIYIIALFWALCVVGYRVVVISSIDPGHRLVEGIDNSKGYRDDIYRDTGFSQSCCPITKHHTRRKLKVCRA